MPDADPVDNSLDLLPRAENLARLYELTSRLGIGNAAILLGRASAQREHVEAYGHRLAFGCCREPESPPQR